MSATPDECLCLNCKAVSPLEHFDVGGADYGYGFCPECGLEVPLDGDGDLLRVDPLDVGGPSVDEIREVHGGRS